MNFILPEISSGRTRNLGAAKALRVSSMTEKHMSATTTGGLIGAITEAVGGDDDAGELASGAAAGAIVGNILNVVGPIVVTYAVGWAVLRGVRELRGRVFGGQG